MGDATSRRPRLSLLALSVCRQSTANESICDASDTSSTTSPSSSDSHVSSAHVPISECSSSSNDTSTASSESDETNTSFYKSAHWLSPPLSHPQFSKHVLTSPSGQAMAQPSSRRLGTTRSVVSLSPRTSWTLDNGPSHCGPTGHSSSQHLPTSLPQHHTTTFGIPIQNIYLLLAKTILSSST